MSRDFGRGSDCIFPEFYLRKVSPPRSIPFSSPTYPAAISLEYAPRRERRADEASTRDCLFVRDAPWQAGRTFFDALVGVS